MKINYLSILWPKKKEEYDSEILKLGEEVIDNLNINGLCGNLTKDPNEFSYIKNIIINMCCDEEVIKYRQDIFEDILSSKGLSDFLKEYLVKLDFLKYIARKASVFEEIAIWTLVSMIKELEVYVNCIRELKGALQGEELKSEGLCKLREAIAKISEDEEFISLIKDISLISTKLRAIKSITLGINIDTSFNPVEATIVSINTTRFKNKSIVKNLVDNALIKEQGNLKDSRVIKKVHRLNTINNHSFISRLINPFGNTELQNAIVDNAKRDMEAFLKPIIRDLMRILNNYISMNGYFLVDLIPEFTFYLKWSEFISNLSEKNMPVCKPNIVSMAERKCLIRDVYNVNLAMHLQEKNNTSREIVLNDINFDAIGRVFILTGPNMGGKSVFTEALGLSQILFQAGLFVPGTEAIMSPVDSIYTHFQVDENRTTDLGRLGEECKRLNCIFNKATKHSLILLNESLASTSFTEGMYIARDVVKFLSHLGVRALFNTHMHELASFTDEINGEVIGDSKVVSLVTGIIDDKRSYKICVSPPLGSSYAKDIALKHGISFEQLTKLNTKDQ